MKNILLSLFIILIPRITLFGTSSLAIEQQHMTDQWMSARGIKTFLENRGQMQDMNGLPVPFVLFKAEAPGVALYITETGLTYLFLKAEEEERGTFKKQRYDGSIQKPRTDEIKWYWERVDMKLEGANINKHTILKEGESLHHSNYFYGHCADGIYGVKHYEKITIKNIYPGIDWVFYNSSDKGFKYDFIVQPGADARQIQMKYTSREALSITSDGSLYIKTAYGNFLEQAPQSFLDGKPIESKYKLLSSEINNTKGYEVRIGFDLPAFSTCSPPLNSTLRIDPALWWATFYSGSGSYDGPMSVDTDNNGNVFVTGYTDSPNFPVMNSGTFYQGTYMGGGADAFILKFNNTGTLLWGTYYGGNGYDVGNSIATDQNGNIFVTGETSSTNFPVCNTCSGFYQGTNASGQEIILLKFDNSGTRLWATYYGGNSWDVGYSIATDLNGNVFVTGHTLSGNFPLLNSGTYFQPSFGGGFNDVFILKFDNSGNRLWATWYGDNGNDVGHAIAVDANGNVYVTGYTDSPTFPVCSTCPGYFQSAYGGGTFDAFILKFDNAGNRLWATWYGGNLYDWGCSLVTDVSGNVFMAGYTESPNLPLQNSGSFYQGTFGGGQYDAFILKFDNNANRLWATYYGGSGYEYFWTFDNLAIDSCSNVYMSFTTQSTNLPTQVSCDAGYFDNSYNGAARDVGLVVFNNNDSRLWATYIGGDGWDFREAMAVDNNNNLFIAGEWGSVVSSATYPVINPGGTTYYDGTFNGGADDGYILKFNNAPCMCSNILTVAVTSQSVLCSAQCTGTATAIPTGGTAPYTYLWSNSQTTSIATGLCATTYTVTITDAGNLTVTATVTITEPPPLIANTGSIHTSCGNNNGSGTVTASGGTGTLIYSWTPSGGTNAQASNLSAGTYTILITDANNCTLSVTLTINPSSSPLLTLLTQTPLLCNGDANGTATMIAGSGTAPYTYLWTTTPAQTNALATGLSAGTYSCIVTDANNCTVTQIVTLTEPTPIALSTGSTETNCTTNTGTATANATGGIPPYSYSWSNSQSSQTATALGAGTYTVTVTDANGCSQTQISIVLQSAGPSITASATATILSPGGSTQLNVTGGGTYLWSPSTGLTCNTCQSPTASPTTTTTYYVMVTDAGGCTALDSITIYIESTCDDEVLRTLLPNAFSPNGDAINNSYCIPEHICILSFVLKVYDRWGEKVFESDNLNTCWDGRYKEKPLNTAVFVYHFECELSNGTSYTQNGNITLVK